MIRGYEIDVDFCEKRAKKLLKTTMPKICNKPVEQGGLGYASDTYWSNIKNSRRKMTLQSILLLSQILKCSVNDIRREEKPKETPKETPKEKKEPVCVILDETLLKWMQAISEVVDSNNAMLCRITKDMYGENETK